MATMTREAAEPAHETEVQAVVAEKARLADGVVELRLGTPDGSALPPWSPGAHVDLVLAPGLVRQYSLCGDPADAASYRLAVLRETDGRGGSAFVHDELREGDAVVVRGPRNNFGFDEAASYLFVAGGIGITPLLPMIAEAERKGAWWRLLYGGRTRASMAFLDTLQRYGERAEIRPEDEHGLLDLRSFLSGHDDGSLVYGCGPEPLLEALEDTCSAVGVDLRLERFSPVREIHAVADQGFEVYLQASDLTIRVGPQETVLHAVEAAGVQVLSSCQEGTCGTCETDVLEGEVEHRDSLLTEAERASNETMMICVSRCKGRRLVLDL